MKTTKFNTDSKTKNFKIVDDVSTHNVTQLISAGDKAGEYEVTDLPQNLWINVPSRSGVMYRYLKPLAEIWTANDDVKPNILYIGDSPLFKNRSGYNSADGYQHLILDGNDIEMNKLDMSKPTYIHLSPSNFLISETNLTDGEEWFLAVFTISLRACILAYENTDRPLKVIINMHDCTAPVKDLGMFKDMYKELNLDSKIALGLGYKQEWIIVGDGFGLNETEAKVLKANATEITDISEFPMIVSENKAVIIKDEG